MRRSIAIIGALGVVLLAAALVWLLVAPGQLVKYPTDLNKTAVAKGTVTLYVDPATGAPASSPQTLPLTIRRNLKVVASTGTEATVQETSTEQIGPAKPGQLLQRYVIDRKTMTNLADPQAYAYTPENVTNRAPAYAINFPFDAGDGPYSVWKNETASAYTFRRAGPDIERNGLTLTPLYGSLADVPATQAYLAELAPMGIRSEMTMEQLAPQLKAQGVDPAVLTEKLLPVLSAADQKALGAMLAAPIAIKYFISVDTRLLVEHSTGAIVALDGINQTMSAAPDLSRLAGLGTMLAKPEYAKEPVVQGTLAALQALPTGPTRVLTMKYEQTPASVADIAAYTQDLANGIDLVETWIPLGLSILGVIMLGASFALYVRDRRPAKVRVAA